MDYGRIYGDLVARGMSREIEGYSERHHIVPKCMGGSNEPSNIVRLTAEEHFIAHKLLVKMYPGHRGLAFSLLALTMNTRGMRPNNKAFGWVRRKVAAAIGDAKRGIPRDPEVTERAAAKKRGRQHKPEHSAKIAAALAGKAKSAAHAAAVGAALKGRKSPTEGGKRRPAETREKIRLAALSRRHTPETVMKMKSNAAAQTQEQRSARAHKAWATKRAKAASLAGEV